MSCHWFGTMCHGGGDTCLPVLSKPMVDSQISLQLNDEFWVWPRTVTETNAFACVVKQSQILIFLNFPPLWGSSVVMWVVEN